MFVAGIFLLTVFFIAALHSVVFSRLALWEFTSIVKQTNASPDESSLARQSVDFRMWGKARIRAYQASLALKIDPPLAVLNIPKLGLTAPVFNGTDELTLNRGVGRIEGTNALGANGNVGIAGHRDGFFRGLKNIELGDSIEIEIPGEKDTYLVDSIKIVEPTDVSVLGRTPTGTMTMITCYPFYFVGDAPHRFVVRASLRKRDVLQEARVKPERQ
jgi:sortase A